MGLILQNTALAVLACAFGAIMLLAMRRSGELVPYDYWDELLQLGFFAEDDPRI